MAKCLYITYDGLTDPLGQAQVLPYLERLSELGHRIHVLSFEKSARRDRSDSTRLAARRAGITWHPLTYTKRPPVLSTVWDLARMHLAASRLHASERFDLIHCRSYLPALAGMRLKRRTDVPFIFDMRGFWPDEKVDAGSWRLANPVYRTVYRFFKRRERELLSAADGVVSLTRSGMQVLQPTLDTHRLASTRRRVIPCSVDFELFGLPTENGRRAARAAIGVEEGTLVLTYLGSIGTWYMLDEMLDFFRVVRRIHPSSRFLFITPDPRAPIVEGAVSRGIPEESILTLSATRDEVAKLLPATDVGVFFIRATPSKVSSSPTKLAELLAMGIPVVTGPGIGDVEQDLRETRGGLVVDSYTSQAYEAAARSLGELMAGDRTEIRRRARELFDVDSAVESYASLYGELLARAGERAG